MDEKDKDEFYDDLSLLKVEIKEIVERKPPNEKILTYKLEDKGKCE